MSDLSRRDLLKRGAALALGTHAASAWAADAPTASPSAAAKDPYADGVLVDGAPAAPAAGSFTIAVLPDTQNYSEKFPEQYHAQTQWLHDEAKARNIVAALHLGDVTNRSSEAEWKVAQAAMRRLDGVVPYFMIPGNHDYGAGGGCQDRTTRFSEFFPLADLRGRPTFGGVYDREPERTENSYHLFSAGGRDFLVMALEFGPRKDVLRWANEVVARHKKREAILVTHVYMYNDDTRYDWAKYGAKQPWNPHTYGVAKPADDVADGEELWNGLVSRHENFILTLNGHVLGDGLGRTTSQTPGGRSVPQMLVNFQMRPEGGDGWLRLLEFQPDGKTVHVCDYSPTRKQRNESPQNKFTLETAAPAT